MSYFNDGLKLDNKFQINGITLPQPTKFITIDWNTVSDGGRLADNIEYEGTVLGVVPKIYLQYDKINQEHYNIIFNQTIKKYMQGQLFFMTFKFPTYTDLGILTVSSYFEATHKDNIALSTEMYVDALGASYDYGGADFDALHTDISFTFICKGPIKLSQ